MSSKSRSPALNSCMYTQGLMEIRPSADLALMRKEDVPQGQPTEPAPTNAVRQDSPSVMQSVWLMRYSNPR